MEDSTKTTLTSILDYILLLLRYVASGFVAIGVYVFLNKPTLTDFKDMSWLLMWIAVTIGIVTYGLHFATLDKILYGYSIMRFLKKNNKFIPDILRTQIKDWEKAKGFDETKILEDFDTKELSEIKGKNKIKRYILFALSNQTYLRSISKNEFLKELQRQVEKRLALLTFLYCSSYQIVFSTFYLSISKIDFQTSIDWPYLIKIIVLLVFAGLILYSSIRFNWRICSREMWLVENFPQKVEDIKEFAKQ